MLTYTTISGREIQYDEPPSELARFLERVRKAAANPKTTPADMILLIYGQDNPLLEHGRVTRAAFENPLYHVMADMLGRKELGDRVEEVAARYTMSPQEAADRLGLHVSAMRQAIERSAIPAWRKGDRWFLDPKDVDTYNVSETGPRAIKGRGGKELAVRVGFTSDGAVFKVRAHKELAVMREAGNVLAGTVLTGWKRIGVLASKGAKARFWELAPSNDEYDITFESFHVRGRFQVAHTINNARAARAAWEEFVPE
jgi:excisionase family DNA binding protein